MLIFKYEAHKGPYRFIETTKNEAVIKFFNVFSTYQKSKYKKGIPYKC